jgi:MFS family permease
MSLAFLPLGKILQEYAGQLRAFKRNARLYLLSAIVAGAAMGIFRLLFNFYLLSLGFDEVFLGNLVTISSLTALVVALPMGYLADVLGRKPSLLLATFATSLPIAAVVVWPQAGVLLASNILFGMAQSLGAVSMSPFLMENSGDTERTYLFSISAGIQMASASLGSWIGGYLPGWIGTLRAVESTSSAAYGGALLAVAVASGLGLLPLVFLRRVHAARAERQVFAPLSYAARQPVLLGKLVLPTLITSIGAGLIMPFMNVFFRQEYGQPDPAIGALFAWGSLSMGLGFLIAPPLAARMGKIQLVVITQGLSIPFLILLGFSPWFWLSAAAYYVRLALMNMSGPVYQTYVMEHVESSARATVASLVSMAWNFGWAFSPTLSGLLQVRYGFGPPFLGTILLYALSVYLYWAFFWRRGHVPRPAPSPLVGD